MKKILLMVTLLFNSIIFAELKINPNNMFISEEIMGGISRNIKISTDTIRLKNLEGIDKFRFKILGLDDNFEELDSGKGEKSFSLNSFILSSPNSRVDNKNNIIDSFSSELFLKASISIMIRGNSKLSGNYRKKMTLLIESQSLGKKDFKTVDIYININIVKSLRLSTSELDLGKAIQGEKLSSKNGSDGILEIDGEKNKEIVVSYPSIIQIYNSNNSKLDVNLYTHDLEKINDEYKGALDNNGKLKVLFSGEVKNTKKTQPGYYKGSFTIKVRYD
ncbi:MAG: DUF4402 domain-containing protein [Cetobacterium somerae]|uniref:DUF4402 domain-containing protein n=1 Tax=Cetobacterium somerae TaxID=188913 RepID=UPI003F3E8208